MRDRLARLQAHSINIRVLVNRRRSVPAIRRNDQHLGRVLVFGARMPLGVTRRQTADARLNPDL